jgi:hypothetical protein
VALNPGLESMIQQVVESKLSDPSSLPPSFWSYALEHQAMKGLPVKTPPLPAISPPAISGTVNDWAPSGADIASLIRITASSTASVTGLQYGFGGRRIVLRGASGATTISHEDAGSGAINRLQLLNGVSVSLSPTDTIEFVYDASAQRWVQVAVSAVARNPNLIPYSSTSLTVPATWTVDVTTGGYQEVSVTGGGTGTLTIASPVGMPPNFTDASLILEVFNAQPSPTITVACGTAFNTAPFTSLGALSSRTTRWAFSPRSALWLNL